MLITVLGCNSSGHCSYSLETIKMVCILLEYKRKKSVVYGLGLQESSQKLTELKRNFDPQIQ